LTLERPSGGSYLNLDSNKIDRNGEFSQLSPTRDEMYGVVVNHEEQYSIWPLDRELPAGWRMEGKQGTKDECLAHIADVWTDMRPLSLRTTTVVDSAGT
jgi:MbtH protein